MIRRLLAGLALQQEPAVLGHQEDGLQVDGKGDGVDPALQHVQHLQLVAVDTRHEHTGQRLVQWRFQSDAGNLVQTGAAHPSSL